MLQIQSGEVKKGENSCYWLKSMVGFFSNVEVTSESYIYQHISAPNPAEHGHPIIDSPKGRRANPLQPSLEITGSKFKEKI